MSLWFSNDGTNSFDLNQAGTLKKLLNKKVLLLKLIHITVEPGLKDEESIFSENMQVVSLHLRVIKRQCQRA